ncbi:hypothetical protein [Desulfosporosinus sp. Sb-LF]|uniref:hypothetical protein n=1 Tax=Desulfosporosinus sp. Sb-LF TaxID=2560027 RepID=UPI0013051E3C|nr:hypothetical protein [Desulfosporosinus sp. Sb-LF]
MSKKRTGLVHGWTDAAAPRMARNDAYANSLLSSQPPSTPAKRKFLSLVSTLAESRQ